MISSIDKEQSYGSLIYLSPGGMIRNISSEQDRSTEQRNGFMNIQSIS